MTTSHDDWRDKYDDKYEDSYNKWIDAMIRMRKRQGYDFSRARAEIEEALCDCKIAAALKAARLGVDLVVEILRAHDHHEEGLSLDILLHEICAPGAQLDTAAEVVGLIEALVCDPRVELCIADRYEDDSFGFRLSVETEGK